MPIKICRVNLRDSLEVEFRETIAAFNAAASFVAAKAKETRARQHALHAACYAEVRQKFGLSANLAVRAISRGQARCGSRGNNGASQMELLYPKSVEFDTKIFKFISDGSFVTLRLLKRRALMSVKVKYQDWIDIQAGKPKSAVLFERGHKFYIGFFVK
jgi:hypothetical protein